MKHLPLIICLAFVGCVEHVGPRKPDTPTPRPANTEQTIKPNDLWEALALAVERGDIETTDRLLKVTAKAVKTAGHAFPEAYDATMKQFMDGNKPLTEALQRDAALKLRGFKTR